MVKIDRIRLARILEWTQGLGGRTGAGRSVFMLKLTRQLNHCAARRGEDARSRASDV